MCILRLSEKNYHIGTKRNVDSLVFLIDHMLSSSDNYIDGYLSTTVHTPVKRYVPSTNTTAVATESTASISTCTMNGYHHHSLGSNLPQQQLSPQQTQPQQSTRTNSSSNNTMPSYRYRMKCCSNFESCGGNNSSTIGLVAGRGLYRADAIGRPSEKSTSGGGAQITSSQTQTQSPASLLSTSFGLSSSSSGSNSSASSVRSSMRNTQNEHINVGEIGGTVSGNDTFNTIPSSNIIPTNAGSNNVNGTCLHCSTIRRTTGVHQTTQTGPISPTIPQTSASSMSQWDTTNVGTTPIENINDSQVHASSRNHTFTSTMPYQQQSAQTEQMLTATAQEQQQQIQQQQPATAAMMMASANRQVCFMTVLKQ